MPMRCRWPPENARMPVSRVGGQAHHLEKFSDPPVDFARRLHPVDAPRLGQDLAHAHPGFSDE